MAYEIVQADDGVTMPACSSRVEFYATAADQFNHPAKCPSDKGIKQHRQQLHHMCSPGEVDVEEVLLLGQPPVGLLRRFVWRKLVFRGTTIEINAVGWNVMSKVITRCRAFPAKGFAHLIRRLPILGFYFRVNLQ